MKKTLMFLTIAGLLMGCRPMLSRIHIIDVEQGNIITTTQVQKLHTGMSYAEVVDLLGTPVLHNTFSDNRLDYYYSIEKPRQARVVKHLVIYFANGHVQRIER